MSMKKTITDYKLYLDEIERLSKSLSKGQKESLETILRSQLCLLISLKRNSNLGALSINF